MFSREDKKNTSRIFFGIVLYAFILQSVVVIMQLAAEGSAELPSWMKTGEAMDDGAVMLCAVFTGCLIMWIYLSAMQKKHGLFNLKCYVHYTGPGEPWDAAENSCRVQSFDNLWESVFRSGLKISWRILFIGLCYAICCQIICSIFSAVIESFFNGFGLSTALDDENFNVSTSIPMALYIAFLGPFAEELVYRGFLMNGLKPYGKTFAIVVSAVFFSLMHGNLDQIPFAFLCGILLGYVASEYSVAAATLVHMINNGGLSFGLIGLQKVMSETGQAIVILLFMLTAVIVMVTLIIRHRRDIVSFIRENETRRGACKCFISIWVLIFLMLEAAEIALSVTPLR